MGTFLTTPRMSPALRARVERAVSHRARAVHHASRLGLDKPFASGERVRFARLFPLLVAVVLGALGTMMYVQDKREVAAERRAIEAALTERRASLPKGYEAFLAAADRVIADASREAPMSDARDPALRGPEALDALLRRPSVYVHAPRADLADPQKLDGAVRSSTKDAFLVCLHRPPASSSERDLLAKVRGVYFDGAKVDDETKAVRRLADARAAIKLAGPTYDDAARVTRDLYTLAKIRREIAAAPVEPAAVAAKAEILIAVVDLPRGEARVTIVDMASPKPLFSTQRKLEEQGTSPMASLHRAELEMCSLALAVRKAISD